MSLDIPESDWLRFKEIHPDLHERYCARILEEVAAACRGAEGTAYDRYVKVYKLIQDRDKQMAQAFGDFRRSTAIMQLGIMRRMKLLADEDQSMFSEQTRMRIEGIASL